MSVSERIALRLKAIFKAVVPERARPALVGIYAGARRPVRSARRRRMPPISSESLSTQLRASGVGTAPWVMVHSSLSRLGNVAGGAEGVIDALETAMGPEGTILMPAFGNADHVLGSSSAVVDLRTAPSVNGQITETFRRRGEALRSSHPFSSICASGPDAQYLTEAHHTDIGIAHAESPMGRLLQRGGGHSLGLGVHLGPVSFYHVIEDTWPEFPLNPYREPEQVTYIDADGRRVSRTVRRYSDRYRRTRIDQPSSIWLREQMAKHLENEGVLRWFAIGECRCWLIENAGLYRELQRLARLGVTIYSTQASSKSWQRLSDSRDPSELR